MKPAAVCSVSAETMGQLNALAGQRGQLKQRQIALARLLVGKLDLILGGSR